MFRLNVTSNLRVTYSDVINIYLDSFSISSISKASSILPLVYIDRRIKILYIPYVYKINSIIHFIVSCLPSKDIISLNV